MVRITGGRACGILLKVIKNQPVRPATDFIREQIFNRLGEQIQNKSILDLFAGVGSYGFEALSRGAKSVCFVEKNRLLAQGLLSNASVVCKSAGLPLETFIQVRTADVFHFDFSLLPQVEWIFMDPPYILWNQQKSVLEKLLIQLAHVFSKARLVLESPGNITLNESTVWLPIMTLSSSCSSTKPCVRLYKTRGPTHILP